MPFSVKALTSLSVVSWAQAEALNPMSKAAVAQMTRAMAIEWGRFGLNINAICPGYIRTELNDHHWDTEAGQKLISMTPRKRLGMPDDLDGLMLLLASGRSGFMNGSVITIDDGFSL